MINQIILRRTSLLQARMFGTFQKAVQKPLPYSLNALEPVLSQRLMEFHYGKHHLAYVNNLNAAAEQAHQAEEDGDHQKYVDLSQAIKFNGGGHLNHEFFWESLAPPTCGGGSQPASDSPLGQAITRDFGSYDNFVKIFSANTAAIQGSGWGWLAYNKNSKGLEYRTTFNQDRLVDQGAHLVPLLTIDIWEHAYYLDYQNLRPKFMTEIWKVVNWAKVAQRYEAARQ